MPYHPRLDILRNLREARNLSQADMARLCGLQGKQSQQTAGAWERGEMIPSKARRGGMMRYLWDGLRLREEPANFEAVWEVLVDVWLWEPISDREWAEFTHQPRPQLTPKVDGRLARLEAAIEQVQSVLPEAVRDDGQTLIVDGGGLLSWRMDRLPEPAPLPSGSVMPLSRNPFFVGREQDLLDLASILREQQMAAISPVGTAAATGLGGIGKTQLASEFVHRFGRFFPGGVFWLSFENASAIPSEVAACGGVGAMALRPDFAVLSPEEQVKFVQAAWREPIPRLLVFDNCEEPELVARWRPVSGGCRILITSRRGDWEPFLNVRPLPLAVFARHESIALLRYQCPDADDALLDAIAAELGDLPLALHLAGSYLYRYRRAISPQQYLVNLRDPNLLRHPSFQGSGLSPTAHVSHVGRTFALSYERLRPDEGRDKLAMQLLMHMATFAPGEPVWYEVLVQTLDLDSARPDEAVQAEDAFARLIELGLLQVEADKGTRIHRLVALFVEEVAPDAAAAARRKIEEVVYANLARANQEGAPRPLLPGNVHMRHVVDAAIAHDVLWGATFAIALGRYLWQTGDYAGARIYFEQSLAARRAELGDESIETAQSYHELGYLLRDMADFEAGRGFLERALALRVQLLGDNHADVADTLNELGTAYWFEHQPKLALATLEKAYAICEALPEREHLVVTEVACNLGLMLLDGERDALRALPYIEESLRIRRHLLGEQHQYTAAAYHNLGYVLEAMGELNGAKAAYEQALGIYETMLTDEHPSTTLTLSLLGALLTRMGQNKIGRTYLARAAEVSMRTLGQYHNLTAVNFTRLALNLQEDGEYERARTLLLDALDINDALYGRESLSSARTLLALGKLCIDARDGGAASDYLARALVIGESLPQADGSLVMEIRELLQRIPD